MKKIRVFVAGKINLSLNILGVCENLHLLDSVMASVDLGDYVSVALRTDNKINIRFEDGEGCPITAICPENNTVKKTVDLLRGRLGDFGADIVVEKHIPVAAGLGGSSADIAGVLFAFDQLLNLGGQPLDDLNGRDNSRVGGEDESRRRESDMSGTFGRGRNTESLASKMHGFDLMSLAATLGSDVPFMLAGGCARVTGTGDIITPLQNSLRLYMVVANGSRGVSSGQAYRRFDELNPSFVSVLSDNGLLSSYLHSGDKAAVGLFDNALTAAAEGLCGGVYSLLRGLDGAGAIKSVMTGSGSAVVGFFEDLDLANAAANKVKAQGVFARVCRFVGEGVKVVDQAITNK